MKSKRQRRVNVGLIIWAFLTMGILLSSYTPVIAKDRDQVQGLVDKARVTLKDFMSDPNYIWLHENIKNAKGVLIFPQVIKGGFIFGGSGGTGVLIVRDERTGNWGEPAFYILLARQLLVSRSAAKRQKWSCSQ